MKTKALLICLIVGSLFLTSLAGAETFNVRDCLYIDVDENGKVFHRGNPADTSILTLGEQYCPDQLKAAGGGICDVLRNKYHDFVSEEPGTAWFQLNMRSVDKRGQVAFNDHSGRLWLLLPNPKVVIGKNLALEMSHPNSGSEDGRGGAHIVYTGHGYVPKYPIIGGGEACRESVVNLEVPTISVAEKPKKAVPQKKFKKRADGTICEEPCIQETLQNTRKIKTDVKEIKESVGTSDKTDAADEKTVQQKARKTLKKVKHIKKEIGTSKRPGGTLQGKTDEVHKDLKRVRALTEKMAEKQGISVKEVSCIDCHVDKAPKK